MHHRPWHVARNGYLATCWATGSIARGMQHAPQRAATQSCDVAVCPVPRGNGESAQLAAAMQCGFPGALDVEDDNPETHTRFQRNQAASMPWDRDCTLGRRCALGLRTTVCGGGPIALCSYCAVVVQSARTFVMRPFLPFPFTPPQIHSLLRTHASIHASRLQAYSTIVGSLAGCIVGGAPRRTVRCAALRWGLNGTGTAGQGKVRLGTPTVPLLDLLTGRAVRARDRKAGASLTLSGRCCDPACATSKCEWMRSHACSHEARAWQRKRYGNCITSSRLQACTLQRRKQHAMCTLQPAANGQYAVCAAASDMQRVGYHVRWDTMSCGIPCRVG